MTSTAELREQFVMSVTFVIEFFLNGLVRSTFAQDRPRAKIRAALQIAFGGVVNDLLPGAVQAPRPSCGRHNGKFVHSEGHNKWPLIALQVAATELLGVTGKAVRHSRRNVFKRP